MKRASIIICCLLLVGGVFWFFPLFHIVRIESLEAAKRQSNLNPAEFTKAFWNERLIPSLNQAPDAAVVLAALHDDPHSARARFGRKVGVSRTTLIALRGSGTIVVVDKKGVGVALKSKMTEPDIILQTGLLFGNTVRDATGLLDASNFSDSRQFNEVSTELNRTVESRVISLLKKEASVGRHLNFAGCVEIADDVNIGRPLTIIPLDIRVE